MSHYDYANMLGRTWNLLWPRKPVPPMPAVQPRDHAIRALFDYLAMVEWRHEGPGGATVAFTIPRAHMLEEKADDMRTLELPFLVVDPKRGSQVEDKPPLGPPIVWENTYDGENVLIEIGLYRETFNLEVWASTPVARRAILAGMDIAFAPTGDFGGMSFTLPSYHGVWCWFGLNSTTRYDDAQVSSRRRYGVCEVELWVPLVHMVPIGFFKPRTMVHVDNPDANASTDRSLWDTSIELVEPSADE